MMSKAAKESLSKTAEMPLTTMSLARYSDLECAVLCHLAEREAMGWKNKDRTAAIRSNMKETQEWPSELAEAAAQASRPRIISDDTMSLPFVVFEEGKTELTPPVTTDSTQLPSDLTSYRVVDPSEFTEEEKAALAKAMREHSVP